MRPLTYHRTNRATVTALTIAIALAMAIVGLFCKKITQLSDVLRVQ